MDNPNRASGNFEVKLTPAGGPEEPVGRLTIAKTFHGDLEATSAGEMLAFGTSVEGSAGYVAMEKVTGKLGAKSGSFALQHTGTMNRGAPSLTVTVVPDSGTEELAGLTGQMTIDIVEGQHLYGFNYSLPD